MKIKILNGFFENWVYSIEDEEEISEKKKKYVCKIHEIVKDCSFLQKNKEFNEKKYFFLKMTDKEIHSKFLLEIKENFEDRFRICVFSVENCVSDYLKFYLECKINDFLKGSNEKK